MSVHHLNPDSSTVASQNLCLFQNLLTFPHQDLCLFQFKNANNPVSTSENASLIRNKLIVKKVASNEIIQTDSKPSQIGKSLQLSKNDGNLKIAQFNDHKEKKAITSLKVVNPKDYLKLQSFDESLLEIVTSYASKRENLYNDENLRLLIRPMAEPLFSTECFKDCEEKPMLKHVLDFTTTFVYCHECKQERSQQSIVKDLAFRRFFLRMQERLLNLEQHLPTAIYLKSLTISALQRQFVDSIMLELRDEDQVALSFEADYSEEHNYHDTNLDGERSYFFGDTALQTVFWEGGEESEEGEEESEKCEEQPNVKNQDRAETRYIY